MQQSRSHTLIEHPADVGIEARGGTLAEAFEEAAYAMFSMIAERSAAAASAVRIMEVEASDPGQLLVKFLSELLYLYDGERFLPSAIRITELSDTHLTAEISGEIWDLSRHTPITDIKAVTYHQLEVDTERHRVRVFLDM